MKSRQTFPQLWLLSDARNDTGLERAIARLPRGSGFVFRHYHLPKAEREARFHQLARLARRRGMVCILSGTARQARAWGADGIYGGPEALRGSGGLLRLATVHSLSELARAHRARADAVLISPVFPTRSHPGGAVLGPVRFHTLARHARCPKIALGGMTRHKARTLRCTGWAAIDGLC